MSADPHPYDLQDALARRGHAPRPAPPPSDHGDQHREVLYALGKGYDRKAIWQTLRADGQTTDSFRTFNRRLTQPRRDHVGLRFTIAGIIIVALTGLADVFLPEASHLHDLTTPAAVGGLVLIMLGGYVRL